jgi:DNA-binding MarR family transcriptional regulator
MISMPNPGDQPTPPAPAGDPATDGRAEQPSDDAIDVGQLLVELIHVVYATRDTDASGETSTHGGEPLTRPAVSAHAIRAAMHIGRHGSRTIGEIADGIGISIGWASRVVSELEASGMVVRGSDPGDRRVFRISLSEEATDVVERAYLWRAEAIDRALAPLDAAGRAAVRTFLRHAVEELPRARPSA